MTDILAALLPVIVLLALGVGAAIASRMCRLSPIVGYLLLGVGFKAAGINLVANSGTVALLADLGVVFLLFDIGLHFSLGRIRHQAGDIFGFGPLQVLFGTVLLGGLGWVAGLAPIPAMLLGAVLALSSTAVVAPVLAERHQQNCPVGLTATAILIFQDVAAIILLIVAGALGAGARGAGGGGAGGGELGALLPLAGLALLKAGLSFAVAVALARFVVRPLFAVIARQRQEEVFTATALLIALAAGWATGHIGLSLTLGAFLGGVTVAETPYRAVVQSEINPFRGLLLGFFFISVGMSLDVGVLVQDWPLVIAMAAVIVSAKILSNAAASLVFRWSVPGSLQLGFLLSQGSEFAFVVFSLPAMRLLIGAAWVSIAAAAVALTLALTPGLASAGRIVAGQLRRRAGRVRTWELQMRELQPPVMIIGMGRVGRALADALHAFDIEYSAVERDPRRLSQAVADGYSAVFGDMADPRLWEPVAMHGRRISALTAASYETMRDLAPIIRKRYPELLRYVVVASGTEAARFHALGVHAVIGKDTPDLHLAAEVLGALGVAQPEVTTWLEGQRKRATGAALVLT
ncbi:cation:proton antiporter [Lichenicoccus sp.]|uniref:cation:proton antiporter domain-containing protein n=1 Tax=Lichenicoccus sp. TaxID=2781899 RepID=UPI003D0BAA84